VRILPFPIHNSEGDVFVWWAGGEMKEHRFFIPWFFHDLVGRCFGFIDEIGVENVELHDN